MFYIRYFGALIYDGIILIALFFLFTTACLFCRHGTAIPPASLWYQLTLLFIIYGYYFLSYRRGGQTIGMRAWHIKLVSLKESENQLSKKQTQARFFLIIPAFICAIVRIKSPMKLLKDWTKSHIIRIY